VKGVYKYLKENMELFWATFFFFVFANKPGFSIFQDWRWWIAIVGLAIFDVWSKS